jgi:uncharacterized tellurite resistance protein B-like protein
MKTFAILIPFLFSTLLASAAEARGIRMAIPTFTKEQLLPVPGAQLPWPTENPTSLCILVETHSVPIPGVNFFQSVKGYVLSEANCQADRYRDLSPEEFTTLKQAGLIAETIPDKPRQTLTQLLVGAWAAWVTLGLFLFGMQRKMSYLLSGRHKKMNKTGASAILHAMCLAAHADGEIADAEIDFIKLAAEKWTGRTYPRQAIHSLVADTNPNPDMSDISEIVSRVGKSGYDTLIRSVLYIVSADGRVVQPEWDFVLKIASAIQISGDQLRALVSEIAPLHQR